MPIQVTGADRHNTDRGIPPGAVAIIIFPESVPTDVRCSVVLPAGMTLETYREGRVAGTLPHHVKLAWDAVQAMSDAVDALPDEPAKETP